MSSISRFRLLRPPPAMMIWLLRKAVAKNRAPNRSGKVKPLDPPPPQPQLLRDSMKRKIKKIKNFYSGPKPQKNVFTLIFEQKIIELHWISTPKLSEFFFTTVWKIWIYPLKLLKMLNFRAKITKKYFYLNCLENLNLSANKIFENIENIFNFENFEFSRQNYQKCFQCSTQNTQNTLNFRAKNTLCL